MTLEEEAALAAIEALKEQNKKLWTLLEAILIQEKGSHIVYNTALAKATGKRHIRIEENQQFPYHVIRLDKH